MWEGQVGAFVEDIRKDGNRKESEKSLDIIDTFLDYCALRIPEILESKKVVALIVYGIIHR